MAHHSLLWQASRQTGILWMCSGVLCKTAIKRPTQCFWLMVCLMMLSTWLNLINTSWLAPLRQPLTCIGAKLFTGLLAGRLTGNAPRFFAGPSLSAGAAASQLLLFALYHSKVVVAQLALRLAVDKTLRPPTLDGRLLTLSISSELLPSTFHRIVIDRGHPGECASPYARVYQNLKSGSGCMVSLNACQTPFAAGA